MLFNDAVVGVILGIAFRFAQNDKQTDDSKEESPPKTIAGVSFVAVDPICGSAKYAICNDRDNKNKNG